jgi:hypothetical protein
MHHPPMVMTDVSLAGGAELLGEGAAAPSAASAASALKTAAKDHP